MGIQQRIHAMDPNKGCHPWPGSANGATQASPGQRPRLRNKPWVKATSQRGPGENQATPIQNVEEPKNSAPPHPHVKPCPMHPESLREKRRRHCLLCESIAGRSPAETQRRGDMGKSGFFDGIGRFERGGGAWESNNGSTRWTQT
jgi:hypothetical protein